MSFLDWINRHEVTDNPMIPASTVVLVRDGTAGLETLMMRRSSRASFADSAWVFPGGGIDPVDHEGAEAVDEPLRGEHVARVAAVRECHEEAGLTLPVSSLVHYAHWVPPASAPKRYSTWFFLAPAPDGIVDIDQREIVDHAWWRPADALARADDRRIEILPPTWITLLDLGQFSTAAEAIDAAANREPRCYATHLVRGDGHAICTWEGDASYGGDDPDVPGPRHRLVMHDGPWVFELA